MPRIIPVVSIYCSYLPNRTHNLPDLDGYTNQSPANWAQLCINTISTPGTNNRCLQTRVQHAISGHLGLFPHHHTRLYMNWGVYRKHLCICVPEIWNRVLKWASPTNTRPIGKILNHSTIVRNSVYLQHHCSSIRSILAEYVETLYGMSWMLPDELNLTLHILGLLPDT